MISRRTWWAVVMGAGLLAAGCCKSGSGESSLELTYPGGAGQKMPVTSGWVYRSTKTFTGPTIGSKKSTIYHVYLANHELDPTRGTMSLGKDLDTEGQLKVSFALTGKDGTSVDDPLPTGTYSTTAERFDKGAAPFRRPFSHVELIT